MERWIRASPTTGYSPTADAAVACFVLVPKPVLQGLKQVGKPPEYVHGLHELAPYFKDDFATPPILDDPLYRALCAMD